MQSKRPRFNPLILALALAAVLMVWSVLGGTGSASSSSMEYSTVVHYFESLQVTQFSLDLNTGVITMNLKEGGKNNLPLPDTTSQSTTQATGGLLSGMLSSSDEDTAAQKNSDGTVTVRYKLPYASMFVKYVGDYIAAYDEANPDAPMVYDYTPVKESIPWMEILFYLAMLGCTGFLLFSMMRGGAGGGGIMNVGKAKVKDEHENQKTATFADVADEFMDYIRGAELVIHNASFDIGFMDYEFSKLNRDIPKTNTFCKVTDSLALARKMFPGKRNSLDALCSRYEIDNTKRTLHGALLDAQILADVYLMMTGGQTSMAFSMEGESQQQAGEMGIQRVVRAASQLRVVYASDEELVNHESRLDLVQKKGGSCLWRA